MMAAEAHPPGQPPGPLRTLLAAVEVAPEAQYGMFVLQDSMGYDLTPLDNPADDEDVLLHAGVESVVLHSAGTDFYPEVRLETWARDPVAPPGEWDRADQTTLVAPSGLISLVPLDGSPVAELPAPAEHMAVRVWCRGRDAATQAVRDGEFDFRGVERWVIQVSPLVEA